MHYIKIIYMQSGVGGRHKSKMKITRDMGVVNKNNGEKEGGKTTTLHMRR